jgi:hypothetical protein
MTMAAMAAKRTLREWNQRCRGFAGGAPFAVADAAGLAAAASGAGAARFPAGNFPADLEAL